VRFRRSPGSFGGEGLLEAWWPVTAAGVAQVARGAVAADLAQRGVARVATVLPELLPERPELAGRGMEAATVVARPRLDGDPPARAR
jgi:hypothetical protein